MHKLGIVGGASWSSTALYYEHINRGVAQRLGGLHSARLVIESIDMEDDYVAFHRTDEWDRANATVVDAAKRLKAAGAEGLLLASNTLHKARGPGGRGDQACRWSISATRPPTGWWPTAARASPCSARASP